MRSTHIIMGMPVILEITDLGSDMSSAVISNCVDYLKSIDEQFSPYKESSEVTKINHGLILLRSTSSAMREVLSIAEKTKHETYGYFDVYNNDGIFDPSGIVKGWAICNTVAIIKKAGSKNYYVDAGGDIAVSGNNAYGNPWTIGIKHPIKKNSIVKVLSVGTAGIATSGSYERGSHIYNPLCREDKLDDVISVTVIGSDILEADRFATAAFAMGKKGIEFIESRAGIEGYQIDRSGIATQTSGFSRYITHSVCFNQ